MSNHEAADGHRQAKETGVFFCLGSGNWTIQLSFSPVLYNLICSSYSKTEILRSASLPIF